MQERYVTPGFLLLSVFIFLLLIPGGPIESRIWPDVPFFVALSISLLATILFICAIFSVFHTRRGGRQALYMAAWEGGGFATFYLFDLLGIFPVSTMPMGGVVKMLEIAGIALAALLIASAMRDLSRPMPENSYWMSWGERASLIALAVYTGSVLTIIATVSTIFEHPGYHIWKWMR